MGILIVGPPAAQAAVISTSSFVHVASVDTLGEYDNAQLGYWNGQPLSPTNHPSSYDDQLSARWDFYVDPLNTNDLFIVASDVKDSNFGYISGAPFDLVGLTGFNFSIQTFGALPPAAFSSDYAVPGEALVGPSSGSSVPLLATPGWSVASSSIEASSLQYDLASSGADFGLTHFSSIYGETRIYGGGVFGFTFSPNVDLLSDLDFQTLSAEAVNGGGAYVEQGTLTFALPNAPVPEPEPWLLMITGVALLGGQLRRRAPRSLA